MNRSNSARNVAAAVAALAATLLAGCSWTGSFSRRTRFNTKPRRRGQRSKFHPIYRSCRAMSASWCRIARKRSLPRARANVRVLDR